MTQTPPTQLADDVAGYVLMVITPLTVALAGRVKSLPDAAPPAQPTFPAPFHVPPPPPTDAIPRG